jgi:PAS domain S-box-containing protein
VTDLPVAGGENAGLAEATAWQRRLLDSITTTGSLTDHLTTIAEAIERETGWRCAILVQNTSGSTLRVEAAPTLPWCITSVLEGDTVGPASGTAGIAAYRRGPVSTPNLSVDPLWGQHQGALSDERLACAWATPIIGGGDFHGVLIAFGEEATSPDARALTVFDLGSSIAAFLIEHDRSEPARDVGANSYERLWGASADVVIIIDEGSRIVSVSPAVERVFGYTPEELQGEPLAVLQPEGLREAHRDGMREHVETGARKLDWQLVSITGLHRDGHEIPVEISFCDASCGGKRLWAGFIRDISARVAAEQALRESEARYRALAENALDLVCELGADGRFVYISPNFKRVLGYEPAQLIGESPWAYINEEDRARVADEFRELVAVEREPGASEFRFLRATPTSAAAAAAEQEK